MKKAWNLHPKPVSWLFFGFPQVSKKNVRSHIGITPTWDLTDKIQRPVFRFGPTQFLAERPPGPDTYWKHFLKIMNFEEAFLSSKLKTYYCGKYVCQMHEMINSHSGSPATNCYRIRKKLLIFVLNTGTVFSKLVSKLFPQIKYSCRFQIFLKLASPIIEIRTYSRGLICAWVNHS
jgi:hypothetical protein